MKAEHEKRRFGVLLILIAFTIWGLSPLYFKLLIHVYPLEILAQRAIWSLLFLLSILYFQKQIYQIKNTLKIPRFRYILLSSTTLISANWLIFIWAILNNYIMEASLGYFLTPILNIFLGMVFLKERLTGIQKICLFLTLIAILIQILSANFLGVSPWISLGLAITFSFYTLIRKQIMVSSIVGLSIETLYLFPIAFLYLGYLSLNHEMVFASSIDISLLLVFGGIVTASPLLLFVAGSKYLPLSSVGFYQYIAPTGQFLLAVFVYKEKVDTAKLISFSLVWLALGIYISHSVIQIYKNKVSLK